MSQSGLSVLHLLAPAPFGGLEAVVERLAAGQAERGTDVRVGAVVEPGAGRHPFVETLEDAGVSAEALPVPHRSYRTEVDALGSLLDRLGPDVVHTHGYREDVVAGTIARRRGHATVSTVHGFTGGGWKNRLYEWLQRRSLARFDAVVAVSSPLEEELVDAGVAPDRVHVVRNAWTPSSELLPAGEARERLGLPHDAFVAGWVGRLSPEKGPDVFLRAMARPEAGGVLASVVGDGSRSEELERLAESLGIRDRTRFHGRVPDAEALYRAFDVFVLSSRTEGTPVSLFEAMEAGVPVVAARVGGVPDVVGDGEARLVGAENPRALAAAVREVRKHPDRAEEMAERARARLESEFAPGPWLDRYERVYRRALSGSRDRTS